MDKRPDLDALLRHPLMQAVDHELDAVEGGVWARIHREHFTAGARRFHNSSLMLSIAVALVAGVWLAKPHISPEAPEWSAFSPHAPFAPSTLLEQRQ
jgi:hypothetical protein